MPPLYVLNFTSNLPFLLLTFFPILPNFPISPFQVIFAPSLSQYHPPLPNLKNHIAKENSQRIS